MCWYHILDISLNSGMNNDFREVWSIALLLTKCGFESADISEIWLQKNP